MFKHRKVNSFQQNKSIQLNDIILKINKWNTLKKWGFIDIFYQNYGESFYITINSVKSVIVLDINPEEVNISYHGNNLNQYQEILKTIKKNYDLKILKNKKEKKYSFFKKLKFYFISKKNFIFFIKKFKKTKNSEIVWESNFSELDFNKGFVNEIIIDNNYVDLKINNFQDLMEIKKEWFLSEFKILWINY